MRIKYNVRKGEFVGGGLHFLLLRKNASTAIGAALQANGKRARIPFEGERVAVWRDPRDRMLSAWNHYSERGLPGIPAGLTFEQFVKSDDWHLAPQWPVLMTCDRVLRFDQLEEDFEALREDYPWIAPLQRLNSSTSR